MIFTVELYKEADYGKKMVYISGEGDSGCAYPYETAVDVGEIVEMYLTNYHPSIVDDPDGDSEDGYADRDEDSEEEF